jgi:UDP-4-amino-4,6-dideoxy-N-acetyl-beta-L-altrosamine transaminase
MSERKLPYGRQEVTAEDVAAVTEALTSDFLTTGPRVALLEGALARLAGARRAAVVSSGTAALHAAYHALGLGAGDEIVTSPLTFAATANAALYLGARVRFVDVEPVTGAIDPALIEPAIGPRTKLVVPIDYGGHPADYDRIVPAAHARGLNVVADAAHSLGGTYYGRPVGSLADLTTTSFHPVKLITTAEGGAVLGSWDAWVDRVVRFRDHGIERPAPGTVHPDGPWVHEMRELGYNYRLTDVQCALGLSQLSRLAKYLDRRRKIVARYREAFADLQLTLPRELEGVCSGWHLYVVRVQEASRRRAFFERLREHGLLVQVHYMPVYFHPYYQDLGYKRGLCPIAEDFYARCVSLPLFPSMTDEDVESSIERVRKAASATL